MACYLGPGIDRIEGPTTKKVFKIQSDQFNYSRNVPEACELCGKIRPRGHRPYPVCVGCREARFCSKEHQVKHWPEHKAHCKERQGCHQQMRDTNARYAHLNDALGLPSLLERRQILEDWTEVHRHVIEQALVHAIYTRKPKVDLYREYVTFHVAYQPESNCNPSTAFKLYNSSIQPDPQDSLHGPGYRKFRTTMAEADAEMRRDDPGYVGACVTVFNIDGQYTWMTCTYLDAYFHDIPKFPRTTPVRRHEIEWYHVLKFFTDKGVVFRCVGPTVQFWLPGTLDRKGSKFVWRKRTMEELREMGIDFTCTLRRDADVRRIETRASWLRWGCVD